MILATLALTSMIQLAEPPPDPSADSSQCMAKIYELFNRESYAAAATEAKLCWASTADPMALFAAATSYQRLAKCAHALVQLQRLSISSSMAGMADFARERIKILGEQCREKTAGIRLHFSPSEHGPEGILRAKLLATADEELRVALRQSTGEPGEPGKPGEHTIYLHPGEWQLKLVRDDDVQTVVLIVDLQSPGEVIFPDPTPVASKTIVPWPEPPSVQLPDIQTDIQKDRPHRLKTHTVLGLTTLSTSAALVIGGAGLVTYGAKQYKSGSDPNILNRVMFTSNGLAVLGAAAGTGAVAVTDFVSVNERALIAESAAGGLLATGGLIGLVLTIKSYETDGMPTQEELSDYTKQHLPQDYATSALLGFGLGMATSAAISLVVTKLWARKGQARNAQVANRRSLRRQNNRNIGNNRNKNTAVIRW